MWRTHQSLSEGLTLGLIVGTAIWLWLVIIDAVAGQPFRTFHVLGGILTFFMLSRTHPLLEEFKEAEHEE